MGYIQHLRREARRNSSSPAVSESDREEIIAYVKHAVLESYNNGRAAGRGGKKPDRSETETGEVAEQREAPHQRGFLYVASGLCGAERYGAGERCPHPPGGGELHTEKRQTFKYCPPH